MIFLIEYDRPKGRFVTFRRFADADRQEAERLLLEIELELARSGTEHEVVILRAENEENLRRTHGRYFGDFELSKDDDDSGNN